MLISAILIIIMVMCWCIGKLMKRPIYWINILLTGTVFIVLCFYSSSYVFNQEGIRYEEIEWINSAYKEQIYYTENGQAFCIQNDMMVAINETELSYSLDCAYLNAKGYLIFDSDGSFKRLDGSNVYLSEKYGHVYDLQFCSWDIWGNLVTPEKKGVIIRGRDLLPFSLLEEYPGVKERIFSGIGFWIMAVPFLLTMLKTLYFVIEQKKFENRQLYQYFYYCYMNFIISILGFNVAVMTDFSNSFMSFFIYEIVFSGIVLIIIPFIQGRGQTEFNVEEITEVYPKGMTLKDMRQNSIPFEVSFWRKKYITLVLIYIFLWFVICVIHSM